MGGVRDLATTVTLPSIFSFLFYSKTVLIYFKDILRKYNPNLYGQSIGNGNQNSANARYNAAVAGAVSA